MPEIPPDWTEAEEWVWGQIAAGKPADFNSRIPDGKTLDPLAAEDWGEERRIHPTFLQTILTKSAFVEATPYGGVRIIGALLDDIPLNLEHDRLQHQLWLDRCRILIDVKCCHLRVDGVLSLEQSFVAGTVDLGGADIRDFINLEGATFKGEVLLSNAHVGGTLSMDSSVFASSVNMDSLRVGSWLFMRRGTVFKADVVLRGGKVHGRLEMDGSTFEATVDMDSLLVDSDLFVRGATFKDNVILRGAKVGDQLELDGSTFERALHMDSLRVGRHLFMRGGAHFKGEVNLNSAKVGGILEMSGSNFEGRMDMYGLQVDSSLFMERVAYFKGDVNLNSAKVGGQLSMDGSNFEGPVNMDKLQVDSSLFMRGEANFRGDVILISAKVGSNLDMTTSTFAGGVDLTGCTVSEVFVLALSEASAARWNDGASLTLRNTHVGALQDWWRNESYNAWPKTYRIEGFTYDRLGWIGEGSEAEMLDRPASSYIQWLRGDPGSSPQPYEHLARCFREAGEPDKSIEVRYAARERRRRKAWSRVDDYGNAKRREWLRALGLYALRSTIGYGLGTGYFRVLWWVGALTLVGALVLIYAGSHNWLEWPNPLFASLDQLLPIVTLDHAHDALIFGDPSAKPPINPQPYEVLVYFYAHKILGWVLGSFLVAGLAGLTQRN